MAAIHINKDEFQKKVWNYEESPNEWKFKGDKSAIVDFYAAWCGPCKMQTPILEQQVVPAMGGRAKICKVNVDDAKDLAVRYGVKGIPALFIFKDGQVVQQFVGLQRGDALVKALDAALGA